MCSDKRKAGESPDGSMGRRPLENETETRQLLLLGHFAGERVSRFLLAPPPSSSFSPRNLHPRPAFLSPSIGPTHPLMDTSRFNFEGQERSFSGKAGVPRILSKIRGLIRKLIRTWTIQAICWLFGYNFVSSSMELSLIFLNIDFVLILPLILYKRLIIIEKSFSFNLFSNI